MSLSTHIGRIRDSRVVWFNAVVLIMAGVPMALEPVRDHLPPQVFGWLLLITNVFNLAARILWTNKPLTEAAAAKP